MKRGSIRAGLLIRYLLVGGLLVTLFACEGEPKKSTTTAEDKVATPAPPNQWYPFAPQDENALKPGDYVNKLPLSAAASNCSTKVVDPPGIDIHDTGKIVGGLKFNLRPRGKAGAQEANGGNTDLGPVYEHNGLPLPDFYHYKFEAEITWTPNLQGAIYGQMITSDFAISAIQDVEFSDDSPANDYVGQDWMLKPGEKKSDFPVVEVVGNTVRWIDAPGGSESGAYGIAKNKMFVIVYAGACKKITHMKVFKLEYPKKAKPAITYIDPPDKLKDHVKSYKFK